MISCNSSSPPAHTPAQLFFAKHAPLGLAHSLRGKNAAFLTQPSAFPNNAMQTDRGLHFDPCRRSVPNPPRSVPAMVRSRLGRLCQVPLDCSLQALCSCAARPVRPTDSSALRATWVHPSLEPNKPPPLMPRQPSPPATSTMEPLSRFWPARQPLAPRSSLLVRGSLSVCPNASAMACASTRHNLRKATNWLGNEYTGRVTWMEPVAVPCESTGQVCSASDYGATHVR